MELIRLDLGLNFTGSEMIELDLFQVGLDLNWNLFGWEVTRFGIDLGLNFIWLELIRLELIWVENDPGWYLSAWN